MARPKTHTPELRERLMATALEIARTEGLGALALRSLAERAGTSTTAVYALFGNKEVLQRAVLINGFEEFGANQATIPVTDDPILDIAGLGIVYIQWALDHPRLYTAMYGEELAGIAPSAELQEARERAMSFVFDAVRRAIASGAFRPAAEATVVASLWAQVHGIASLTIADQLPEGADAGDACYAAIDGWRPAVSGPRGVSSG